MISPLAYVDPAARIGENVTIHPFAYIDADVEIGDGCTIMPYVSIMSGTRIGKDNKIYQNSVIGADPQDFRWKGAKTYCYIGDNNVIRENVIINRGIKPEGGTRIGNGCFIMAESHIGHDTHIVGRCVIGNGATIAGDAEVGECTILSSGVILHENSVVGPWVLIKGGCRISGNVPPYVIMAKRNERGQNRQHRQSLPPYLSIGYFGVQCPQTHRDRRGAGRRAHPHTRLRARMQHASGRHIPRPRVIFQSILHFLS